MKLWYVTASDGYYQSGAWLVYAESEQEAIDKIAELYPYKEELYATEAKTPEQNEVVQLD